MIVIRQEVSNFDSSVVVHDFTSNSISWTCISMVWVNALGDLILIVDQCDIFHGTVILHRISNILYGFALYLEYLFKLTFIVTSY